MPTAASRDTDFPPPGSPVLQGATGLSRDGNFLQPYLWLAGVDPRLLALLPPFNPPRPVVPALARSGR